MERNRHFDRGNRDAGVGSYHIHIGVIFCPNEAGNGEERLIKTISVHPNATSGLPEDVLIVKISWQVREIRAGFSTHPNPSLIIEKGQQMQVRSGFALKSLENRSR